MRPVKFRVWDKEHEKMIFSKELMPLVFGIDWRDWEKPWLSDPMHYIGIPDRHNNDIFESDILHLRLGHDLLEVRWSVFGYRFFNLKRNDWQHWSGRQT